MINYPSVSDVRCAQGSNSAITVKRSTPPARGHRARAGLTTRAGVVASIRRTYREVRAAWRAGAHLPPDLPVRDYPIARH